MYQQIIGRNGVLREVGPDGYARNDDGTWMKGPQGGLLAVSKDDQFLLEIVTSAQSDAWKAGAPTDDSILFRIVAGPTRGVGRVVQLDGTRFPDTPTTITDPKTGAVTEESQLAATMAAAGGGTNYMVLGGLALLVFLAMRKRR
jgi:hypothetical protein